MKYTYLLAKNFAPIYVAMKKKTIEIDLSKSKNRIILLVGSNGSGKTAILSLLHPFAYAGNMDIRSSSKIILDDCDGYKELHLTDDDNKYIIKHFYQNTKNGIRVKSYLSKNGNELNPNGNVTSFTELILSELTLEPEFMKLIRLGSNVTNLIEMKSSERKNFSSELLSDIDIYSEIYKKINDDNRILKNLITNVSNKISRLNVISEQDLNVEIYALEKEISEKEEELENEKKSLWNEENTIKNSIDVSMDEFISTYEDMKTNLIFLYNDLKHIEKDIGNYNIESINNNIGILEKEKSEISNKLEINSINTTNLYDNLTEHMNRKDEYEGKIKLFTNNENTQTLDTLIKELENKREEYSRKYSKIVTPPYTKEELLRLLESGHEINHLASNLYEFGLTKTQQLVYLYNEKINIDKYIQDKVLRIDQRILNLKNNQQKTKKNTSRVEVLYRDFRCEVKTCPYWIINNEPEIKSENIEETVSSLEWEREEILKLLDMRKIFDRILYNIETIKYIEDKLPNNVLSINTVLSKLKYGKHVFSESDIQPYISLVEELSEYKTLEPKIEKLKKERELISSIEDSNRLLKENLLTTIDKISNINDKIENIKQEKEILQDKLEEIENKLVSLKNKLKSAEHKEIIISNIKDKEKSINDNKLKIQQIETCSKRIKQITAKINNLENELSKLKQLLFNKKVIKKDFKSLSKERDILNKKFEDISILKESLSSTKGIPLLFIQLYLKNTTRIVNNLLERIYGDDFKIDNFEITSTDFNIPYIKNGVRISDVVYASQGERSFLSIALSFALLTQSVKRYNIPLLDEIDATLDMKNRRLFLNILEEQIDIINAEQVFLITHNNMFDDYPVDIIMTSDINIDNYNNACILYKK